jgi:hypothetical protein
MATIYIAGPVIRNGMTKPDWVKPVYDQIRTATGTQAELRFPDLEPYLDSAPAAEFRAEILKRIKDADALIGVYTRESASGPVEMAFAGMLQKPQLVLAQQTGDVPRLIAGLANVTVKNTAQVSKAVSEFLDLVGSQGMAVA